MFLHCVGLIDGMLFPLAFGPMLSGEDYFTRKGNYAVKGLIICDDTSKITWVEMGWLGSVHDNQVWLSSDVYLRDDQGYFNTKLAKVQIKSKHCLGLLKAWFQHLQGHHWVIKSKGDLGVILQVMMCA